MARKLVLFISCASLVAYVASQTPCPRGNETFKDCGPNCEEEVCPSQRTGRFCATVCRDAGCYCSDGYYRIDGRCVAERECPCGKNELRYDCIPYNACRDDRCDSLKDPKQPCTIEYIRCPDGCACDFEGGFRRNADGVCVPISECPKPSGRSGDDSGNGNTKIIIRIYRKLIKDPFYRFLRLFY